MGPSLTSFRKRLGFITNWFAKLLEILTPQARKVGSQRMCPFCGLITSRYKTSCLECGKSLKPA
jgi:hypothetical protein